MPNVLSIYDPLFYAQEGIIALEKALGLASAVYRGYNKDPQQKGSIIDIPVPSTFVAQDAPSTAQDVVASHVQIQLAFWKEVKFKLTDKELTFTTEKIIEDHIRPAAYALSDNIDQNLCALYADIPWFVDIGATAAVADIVAVRKLMFDNNVPLRDQSNISWMLDSDMEADFLANSAFTQWQGAGANSAQETGYLGKRFGFNFWANQNVKTHTPGVAADATGALTVGLTIGTTGPLTFNAVTASGTFKKGDSLVIAGSTQRYVFAADIAADGTGLVTGATIFPAAAKTYNIADVITINLDLHSATLAFHRNAFALAMAPLSEIGNQLGAKIASVSDPITNLALRSRLYYVGNSSEVHVALDVLYGLKTLDPNRAVRGRN